jgi:hypothetical protein
MDQQQLLGGVNAYILNLDHEGVGVVSTVLQTLGGSLTRQLQDATHALLIFQHETGPRDEELRNLQENNIVTAQALSIPIVDAFRWLDVCSRKLSSHQHWSEIDISAFLVSNDVVHGTGTAAVSAAAVSSKTHNTTIRRDARDSLGRSLSKTFLDLVAQDPDLAEQNALKRAIELSMLDQALVVVSRNTGTTQDWNENAESMAISEQQQQQQPSPYQVLGLTIGASKSDIKSAYRNLARQTHPDKGGSSEAFERISRAYRSLLNNESHHNIVEKSSKHLKSTAHWDAELKDHRRLVEELYSSHGANLDSSIANQAKGLDILGLQAQDAGSTNVNENQERIHNSCFYLSLAASYLSGVGALLGDDLEGEENVYLIGETALQLKRLIEAAVVSAHPEWAESGQVGEVVQAFSDFLVYLLDSADTLISDWAVVVFDTSSGFCDIYKGKYYDAREEWQQSNAITIRYLPGHYQPLLPIQAENRPSLNQILESLDALGIVYVITDGAA